MKSAKLKLIVVYGVIAAVVVCGAVTASTVKSNALRHHQANASHSVTVPRTSPVAPPSDGPSATTRPCPKGSTDRESQTCAYWAAADAARDQAKWAFIGCVIAGCTLVAAVAAAVFAGRAAKHAKVSAEATSRATELAQRQLNDITRRRVTFWGPVIRNPGDKLYQLNPFRPGNEIEGELFVVYEGAGTAKIKQSHIRLEWLANLPMKPPYDLDESSLQTLPESVFAEDSKSQTFKSRITTVPQGFRRGAKTKLYMMGSVDITDDLGRYSVNKFCYRFDEIKGIFEPVLDRPEYHTIRPN